VKILSKIPKSGSMTLEANIIPFFNNSRHHGKHIQVHNQEQGME